MTTLPDQLLTVREAAQRLGVSVSFLNKKRLQGGGRDLPYVKIGARVLYDPADLAAFLESRKRRSTSDQGLGAAQ